MTEQANAVNKGAISNPLKAAALMALAQQGHIPIDLSLSNKHITVFFKPTPEFIADSDAYDTADIPVKARAMLFFRQRLLAMKHGEVPLNVRELARLVRPSTGG